MSKLPLKPTNPVSASAFLSSTANKNPIERDKIAADLVINGNFPSFLRKFVPIKIVKDGKSITIKVSSDFMCIGTDSDWIIWSFSAPQSQRIADAFGCVIPTVELSEEIYKHAKIKLTAKTPSMVNTVIDGKQYTPASFVASKHMMSPQGMQAHNDMIRQQLSEYKNYRPGVLVAGHKKDVVIDDSVSQNRLGMHGLYDDSGKAIQQGSLTKHYGGHIEYGMALRLIDKKALMDGKIVDLLKVIKTGAAKELVGATNVSYAYNKSKPVNTSIESIPSVKPKSNNILDTIYEYYEKAKQDMKGIIDV